MSPASAKARSRPGAPRLVLCDLDGTLIPLPSSERRLAARMRRSGMLGPRQMLSWLAFTLGFLPRYGRGVLRKNKAYLAGLPVQQVADWAGQFVHETLLPLVRPAVQARLAGWQRDGAEVLLLTGAPQFLADAVADTLALDGAVGTLCAQQAGRFTADPPLRHPYGADKLHLADALRRERDLAWQDLAALADHHSDGLLLSAVGHPVAVFPDHRLATMARAARWEQIPEPL